MIIVHDEAMANPKVGRGILIAVPRGLFLTENIDVIDMSVEKQNDFSSSDSLKIVLFYGEIEWSVFSREQNSGTSIYNIDRACLLFVLKFEAIWQKRICTEYPMLVKPRRNIVRWSLPSIFDGDGQAIWVWPTKFWVIDGDVSAQLAPGTYGCLISQIASCNPQKYCRERKENGEARNNIIPIFVNKSAGAVTVDSDRDLGNIVMKIIGGGMILFFLYAMFKRP
jgi:hypothetical protein